LLLDAADHSVEISLGKFDQVHSVTFYINRGPGAVALVLELSRRLGVTPYDTETGERLTVGSEPPAAPPPDQEERGTEKRRWWQRGSSGTA
jgi:hypothetical protein